MCWKAQLRYRPFSARLAYDQGSMRAASAAHSGSVARAAARLSEERREVVDVLGDAGDQLAEVGVRPDAEQVPVPREGRGGEGEAPRREVPDGAGRVAARHDLGVRVAAGAEGDVEA